MQNFRSREGYTLVELMSVVGIAGILAVLAIGALRGYARHEDTRRSAQSIANVLTRARSEAVASGRMTFVIFGEPIDGSIPFESNQTAALVIDQNDNQKIDLPDDAVTPIFAGPGISPEVTTYGARGQTAMKATKLPGLDQSRQIAVGDDMTKLTAGSSFPIDVDKGVPIVAFAPQGSPVSTADTSNWGVGAGGMYVTDNDELLVAVIVQPMGEVRTMTFDNGSDSWK